MTHIEIIPGDLTKHPNCPHGPTILFSRSYQGSPLNFFACSACRDRKDCSFYLCESEKDKVSEVVKNQWKRENKKFVYGINHKKLFVLFHEVLQTSEGMRRYCQTCDMFVVLKYRDKHNRHKICTNISDYVLTHPSEFLAPLENPRKEAQFLFSKVAVQTIIDIIKQQSLKNVLCIGTPRVHEHILEEQEMVSLLLDIDKRYHSFFGPLQFCWYNMFNNHFFFEDSQQVFQDFLKTIRGEDIVIIMDPPFGGRVELLAQTIKSINALNKRLNNIDTDIPVLLIFPYFMEPQILNSLPEFFMLDYKVDYQNHVLFQDGPKGRKQGSPVRLFTNINPQSIVLPENQGYKHCDDCKRWVSIENLHCYICNSCTSKDGRTYVHCNKCNKCVKPTWDHCSNCNRCAFQQHDCKEIVFTQACFHCKELGHKKRECPKMSATTGQQTNKPRLTCSICKKQFRWKSGLSRHMKLFHTQNKNYKCKICNKRFHKQLGFKIHLRRHKTLAISKLAKITSKHLNSIHEIVYNSDSDCEYEIIKTVKKLKDASSIIKCSMCQKTFLLSTSLEKHMQRHEATLPDKEMEMPKTFECDKCSKTFQLFSDLLHHSRTHRDTLGIQKSEKSTVLNNMEPLFKSCTSKPFLCMICGKAYTRSGCLAMHLRTHNEIYPYLCSVCGKSFKIKQYLIVHSKTHTQERPFNCQHCNKSFTQKSNLVEHLRIHTGSKPYNCSTCEKRFTHYSGLAQHLLTHNPIKKYSCKICEKTFRLPAHCREHLRVHSGDKPYVCKICTRAFTNSSSLVVHQRTHSGDRPFRCTVCKKGFIKSYGTITELCDIVSHVIYCPDDTTMLITLEPNCDEYWIPSTKIASDIGWFTQSTKDIDEIFGVLQMRKMLKVCKIWVPQHIPAYIFHCIYNVIITGDQKKKLRTSYGRFRGNVKWVSETELIKMMRQQNLRSPELVEFYQLCKGSSPAATVNIATTLPALPCEYFTCSGFTELTDHVIIGTSSDDVYEQLIETVSFNKDVQISLYKKFIFTCFPSLYMCQQVFARIAVELGWPAPDTPFLFKAADITKRQGLTFRELLIILACTEPNTNYGKGTAEMRCRYMFRFFDRDGDGVLNYTEYKLLIAAIRRNKKQLVDDGSVNSEAESSFKSIGLIPKMDSLSLKDFIRAVGDLNLRGTSQLFRSTIGLQQYLCNFREKEGKTQNIQVNSIGDGTVLKRAAAAFKKTLTKIEDYCLGAHVVRFQRDGTLIKLEQMNSITDAAFPSSIHIHQSNIKTPCKRLSQELFVQTSLPNEILTSLRYLIQGNKNLKPPPKNAMEKNNNGNASYSWGKLDSTHFAKNFILICEQVKDILKGEARMVEIQAPVYILGDLHGNLNSLLYFERILWHSGLGLCPCNILFLGDYVDRGPHGLEVIAYLFSHKIQTPKKLILLRGNHEIRDIQKLFTFHTECLLKFGDKLGVEVWNAINSSFDVMPVAATIDRKVYWFK
ncbi:hypothetical protein FQA39_LY11568 [Lamprigera yunnana]|nr:hypothetical protein FQA39_LY11568 [Lamprigera yunnana]